MRRLGYKGEEDKGRHKDGSRIDPRGDVFINGAEGIKEGIAPIDPSLTSILNRGVLNEDAREGSTTGPTRYCDTPASSCSRTGSEYWASVSFYHRRSGSSGRTTLGQPSSYYWPPVAWDASWWWTTTTWRCPTSLVGHTHRGVGGEQAK